jgi:hypothetical protein
MKKPTIILLALISIITANAQQPGVVKSTSGVQVGLLNVRGYYEARLSDSFTLRAEVGIIPTVWWHETFFYNDTGFSIYPVFTVEPRYYYNLNRRGQKGKDVGNNAANFLSINTGVNPGWLIASSEEDASITGGVSVIPTWGMRRNLGKRFEYELGVGIGYGFAFNGEHGVALNTMARIGYRF